MKLFKYKRDKKIEAYQNELMKIHYEEVENMYEDMRGWRHDFKNHLQILKGISLEGNMEDVIKYLDQLDISLSQIEPKVKTGNKMTDAILNSKISLAKSNNIKIVADAHVPVALTIPSTDLSIIIGNLLDNAIEANLKIKEEDRFIRIYMDMKNTQLYISITNGAEPVKKKKFGEIFLSTKGKNHGLGLIRIDDVIERNNGYINRNSEENAFTTEVLLPQ